LLGAANNGVDRRFGSLLDVGVSVTNKDSPQEVRLLKHWEFFEGLFEKYAERYRSIHVAIERPFFTEHNPDTAFGTAQVSGLIMVLCAKFKINIHLYTPSQVKLAVTGSGASQKAQIADAVQKILKLDSAPKPADASDAVAIALTARLTGDISGRMPPNTRVNSSENSMKPLATPFTKAQEIWVNAQKSSGEKGKRVARKM
jgi:crossover junction endodeoxyribonuclease RuvC